MFLLKDVKVSAALCGTLFVLAACSSASFPEITEEDSSAIARKKAEKSSRKERAWSETIKILPMTMKTALTPSRRPKPSR